MRILVTGSRNWTDRDTVREALLVAWGCTSPGTTRILVHGACPTGADALADEAWNTLHVGQTERHPAAWDRLGKTAGLIRNRQMVDASANICLAFPLDDSRGTRHCMRRAVNAGIPVVDCSLPDHLDEIRKALQP